MVFNVMIIQTIKQMILFFVTKSEARRLALLLLGAIVVTFMIADNNADAGVLFQSPASPPAEAPLPPPQPAEQTPAQPPPEQPPVEQPPTEQAPAESPPQESTETTSPANPEATTEPTLSTGSEPPPLPQPTPLSPGREDRFSGEEEESSGSNFILDRIEFIDTVVVSGAYVWLCCGAVLLLLVPLAFILLQIRGQLKIRREETP